VEFAEASVQTIKLGPFKIIHLHHLKSPHRAEPRTARWGVHELSRILLSEY
jgi:hypothetical protein